MTFLLTFSVLLGAFGAPALEARPQQALMPVPSKIESQSGRLVLDRAFSAAVGGPCDPRVPAALTRAMQRIADRTGLELAGAPAAAGATNVALTIECRSAGNLIPQLGEDESYALDVTDKQAKLTAAASVGVLRGLETLVQLLSGDRGTYFLPAVRIDDRPRFPWRGLMIDVGRHWMPMEVIKRNLDGMAAVKLNVLHLHLSEDQGFRIESRKYPKLQQLGSDGLFFTQDQMRDIIRYAADRGIRVVPEFDMPGHATSWLVGYPELASAPGPYQIERKWGIFDPTFDPTREETYKFLDAFLGEMAALFPDAYMHIGGDENNGKQWGANAKIQAFMKAKGIPDAHALQAYFNQRLLTILTKHHKKMVGWDEILHPDLPKDIVVQSWRGQKSLAEGAKQGYQGLLSNGYYLDYIQPASQHYLVDPVPSELHLAPDEASRVLGGEACMWAEFVSPETIDSRIWPRMAPIAERFWSPQNVRDIDDMYRRLDVISLRLEEVGLTHESNPRRMVRRLADTLEPTLIESLVEVVEPVKVYNRPEQRPADQMMPLTRLVDAARPDSRVARRFTALVTAFLADDRRDRGRQEIISQLQAWRSLQPRIELVIDRSPILEEARPLVADLDALGEHGLEAVSYIAAGIAPPAGWHDRIVQRLDQAAKPKAEVELPIVAAVRQLVEAAVK